MAITVQFSDSTGNYADSSLFILDLNAAWAMWSAVLAPTAGTIDFQVNVFASGTHGADGASQQTVNVATANGITTFEYGAAYELRTGNDPNGSSPDAVINLFDNFIQQYYWLDPLNGTPLPAGKNSLVDVFAAIIGHILGVDGVLNPTTYQLPGTSQSVYDSLIAVAAGVPYFTGANAASVYGGPVPLTVGSPTHFGNSSPLPGSDLLGDVLNGVDFESRRYEISKVDTAVLSDLGLATTLSDTLRGTGGADTIYGGRGNDRFIASTATGGVDTLDGGAGRDSVIHSGNRSDYTISYNGGGHWQVTGLGVNENLVRVERLVFADQTVAIGSAPISDFNGDGFGDFLWQNDNGQAAIWNLSGFNIESGGYVGPAPSAGWIVKGSGDFNDDGRGDILWQNTSTGQAAVWLLDGFSVISGNVVGPTPSAGWTVIGSGDFNADGKSDILWQNSTTLQAAVWLLNGQSLQSGAIVGNTPSAGWKVVSSGDFNGDGKSDILWQNTTSGQAAVWLMNGFGVTSAALVGGVPSAGWVVKGSGDFDGDGKSDILWQNSTTGQAAIWLLNGSSVSSAGIVGPTPSGGWNVVGATDANGDGKSDILWQHTSGQGAVWLMNGLSLNSGNILGNNPGTSWHLIGSSG